MGKQIPPDHARRLLENWRAPGAPGKTMAPKYKDTFETWFSVAEIEEYLEYIKANIPASENPGIRIYFGSYGEEHGAKKGYSTVFFAPTKGGAEENLTAVQNDYSLNAYNSGGSNWPPADY
ncbi:hypothetical protein [Christiangramia salexigens]|uniref:Uncharacterized protein n=1 Tax=Christiangramia salexigens TaxID=1913577 RepID=A0A1L3J245_9FLAO|nr:hypothetical protein [Christiangramia salexigens]APG59195.1 hypothetical protein LPB144_01685 [Christiangramia salexigens]